jgi:dienelactone hydrolase
MNERAEVSRLRIVVPIDGMMLPGELSLPADARGVVIFAHDTPGSRHCSCNTIIAEALHDVGIGTLLFDLLSDDETAVAEVKSRLCADIPFLAGRLVGVTRWIIADPICRGFRLGFCGACAGGAAALVAAAWLGNAVDALVVRAAHPDMADGALERVISPLLLIVAEWDAALRQPNERAVARLKCERELAVIDRAIDLFSEPASLRQVADLSAGWFDRHLRPR